LKRPDLCRPGSEGVQDDGGEPRAWPNTTNNSRPQALKDWPEAMPGHFNPQALKGRPREALAASTLEPWPRRS